MPGAARPRRSLDVMYSEPVGKSVECAPVPPTWQSGGQGVTPMVPRIRSGFRRPVAALFLTLLAGSLPASSQVQVAEKSGDSRDSSVVRGQRVFTCGHSFHAFVYP